MSTYWLRNKLEGASGVKTDGGDPILTIVLDAGREERIYCPDSDEYRVTADVVDKAVDLGATIIAYGSWCDTTVEGKLRAKEKGASVLRFGGLFAYLISKGVSLAK